MENTIYIKPEAVKSIVTKYFERISPAQWNMIAEGTADPAIEATLGGMCTEILQVLHTDALNIVKPLLIERIHNSTVQAEVSTMPESFKIHLGDSIPSCFAAALHVPQEKCESAEKLSALLENEVTQKVNSVVSLTTSNPVWPTDPAIYVSGSVCIKTLRQMVAHTAKCLRKSLCSLHMLLLSFSVITDTISLDGMTAVLPDTKDVSSFHTKQSRKTPDITEDNENVVLPLDEETSEIDKVVTDYLPLPESKNVAEESKKSASLKHRFDKRLINKARHFFTSRAATSGDTNNKCCSSDFVQNLFEKMISDLKNALKSQDAKFVVSLKADSEASQNRLLKKDKSHEAAEVLIPGAVPESPRPATSCPNCRLTVTVTEKESAPVYFEDIKPNVDNLINKLHQPETPADPSRTTLENISGEINKFSKELTDKIFNYLMSGQTYQLPIMSSQRCLSDSVISQYASRLTTTKPHLSHEVLYVMTKDAVERFLYQMLLFIEKEPLHKTRDREGMSQNLITALLLRLNLKISHKIKKSLNTEILNVLIKRLSHRMQSEINLQDIVVRKAEDTIKQINKAVIEDLYMKFGSTENLIKAAVASDDTAFDDAVMKYLKIHLNACLTALPGKNPVVRFFSAMKKSLRKSFTFCIKDSRDNIFTMFRF